MECNGLEVLNFCIGLSRDETPHSTVTFTKATPVSPRFRDRDHRFDSDPDRDPDRDPDPDACGDGKRPGFSPFLIVSGRKVADEGPRNRPMRERRTGWRRPRRRSEAFFMAMRTSPPRNHSHWDRDRNGARCRPPGLSPPIPEGFEKIGVAKRTPGSLGKRKTTPEGLKNRCSPQPAPAACYARSRGYRLPIPPGCPRSGDEVAGPGFYVALRIRVSP